MRKHNSNGRNNSLLSMMMRTAAVLTIFSSSSSSTTSSSSSSSGCGIYVDAFQTPSSFTVRGYLNNLNNKRIVPELYSDKTKNKESTETDTTGTTTNNAKSPINIQLDFFNNIKEEGDRKSLLPESDLNQFSTSTMTNTNSNTNTMMDAEGLLWRGVVVILCALWASNFAVAKLIMSEPNVNSSIYTIARFSTAALSLLPFAITTQLKQTKISPKILLGAIQCGTWVAFGYLGQTIGLLSTTASRSCVICSLHCVFVALIAEITRVSRVNNINTNNNNNLNNNNKEEEQKTEFNYKRLIPALLAVFGVAIVELKGAAGAPTIGDLISFAQPIGFGMGYLKLEDLMREEPESATAVSFIKLCVVFLASLGLYEVSPLLNNYDNLSLSTLSTFTFQVPDLSPILSSKIALLGILYTGMITTALALWVESIAFARVPATDASIILTTEPLFAAGAGAIALGETFGMSDYVGASIIICACAYAALMEGEEEDPFCDIETDVNCMPKREGPPRK